MAARRFLLDFEKPLVDLEEQIDQIRQLARDSEVDVSQQLLQLENLAARRRQDIFGSLTPSQKIQVARHPHRPSCLDYIQVISEKWIELHGDRCGSDDQALVGGLGQLGERAVLFLGHQKGRDTKEKTTVSMDGITETVSQLLLDIQSNLFNRAKKYRDEHITKVDSWDDFIATLDTKAGFVSAHWDGTPETEDKIKEMTKATIRCIPLNNEQEAGTCILTGQPSVQRVLFARAY